jgi:hypothetical protein
MEVICDADAWERTAAVAAVYKLVSVSSAGATTAAGAAAQQQQQVDEIVRRG